MGRLDDFEVFRLPFDQFMFVVGFDFRGFHAKSCEDIKFLQQPMDFINAAAQLDDQQAFRTCPRNSSSNLELEWETSNKINK